MQQFAAREIGERIQQARKEAGGMTQEDLAEFLDVSKRQIQNYEAGETIPWKHFQPLATLFKRDLGWFLHGEEQATQPSADESVGAEVLRVVRQLSEDVRALAAVVTQQREQQ